MYWIVLALVLSAPRAVLEMPESMLTRSGGGPADRCEAARAVAEMPACLDPASCRAVDAWADLVGPPRPRLAPGSPGPRGAPVRAGSRLPADPPAVPRPSGRLLWLCPAGSR